MKIISFQLFINFVSLKNKVNGVTSHKQRKHVIKMTAIFSYEQYRVLTLKIYFTNIKPLIWRRVLVPEDYTLYDLHHVIQAVFEWSGNRAHEFRIYDILSLDENTTIKEALLNSRQPIQYIYGGDEAWEFTVLLETVGLADPGNIYPICTAGGKARPPEAIDTVRGFKALLDVLKNPYNVNHEAMWQWVRDYDSDHYFRSNYRFSASSVLK